MYDVSN